MSRTHDIYGRITVSRDYFSSDEEFALSVITAWGHNPEESITRQQAESFAKDPALYVATMHGMTVDQWHEYMEFGGAIQCSARTSSGHRCRHTVSGRIQMLPADWLARYGEYCAIHGGPTSRETRE